MRFLLSSLLSWITATHNSIDQSRHPAILRAHIDWRYKNDVTWFLRGQVSDNVCRYKKLRSRLFILNKRKWNNFSSIDASRKLWVKVIMAHTFLDAVKNADVLTASNNDVKLVDDSSCKFAWLKSSSYWASKETRPRLTLLANFTTYLPREIPGDITFMSSVLKLVQRWWVSWIKSIRSSLSRKEKQTYSSIQIIPPSMNFSSNIERLPRISHRKVCNFPMSKANDFARLRSRGCIYKVWDASDITQGICKV